jgi:hypothetical protein
VPAEELGAATTPDVRLTQSELALFTEGCTLLDRRSLSPIVSEKKTVVSDRAL